MSDGKPEQVKMSHVHALDRRISDHRLEVNKSLNDTLVKLITPINELTSEIKLSNKNHDHLKSDLLDTKKDLSRLDQKVEVIREKAANSEIEVAKIKTTQGGILGVSGKVFPVFMSVIGSAMVLLLSVSIYLKISP